MTNENSSADLNFRDVHEQSFPADFATEDLFSVYNRLYSHAKNQMRTKVENQLAVQRLNSASKVSVKKSEQIGNRLYNEARERERRKTAQVLAASLQDQAKREVSKVAMKSH